MARLVKQYRESKNTSDEILLKILDKLDKLELAEEENRLAIFPYTEKDDIEIDINGKIYYIVNNIASIWLSQEDGIVRRQVSIEKFLELERISREEESARRNE